MPVGGFATTRGLVAAFVLMIAAVLALPFLITMVLLWAFGALSKKTAIAALLLCAVGWAVWLKKQPNTISRSTSTSE
jgi:hypothetical protein